MTTKEFVKQYKNAEDKALCLSSILKVTKYVPVEEKILLMSRIADGTTHNKIGNKQFYKQDSFSEKVLFDLVLVNEYTNIDIDFKQVTVEYNALEKEKLIEKIISLIPKREVETFATILACKKDDIRQNERSILSFLEIKFESLKELLSGIKTSVDKYTDSPEGKKFIEELQERFVPKG